MPGVTVHLCITTSLSPLAGAIARPLRMVKSTMKDNLAARVTRLISKLSQLMNQFDFYKSQ